ncbi:MAG: tetratricopeptide repeat protein, partial [Candidatus Krumholzibacteria bacterium]|nr:tetratricopeptide repeat protein [Candidatus Krumholzibacteria bacterium]
ANVMITKDGHVKVLDFGLAKLAETGPSTPDDATQALGLTQEGSVLGTVPYMSPEQLRGRDVDSRSDIFSLGVLLYELSAGRRPFQGDNSADLTSSILVEVPSPLTELKPGLPRHLGRIVARCLEKEPKDRYQSALDIRNELRGLRREVESGVSQTTGPIADAPTTAATGRGKSLWAGLTVAVAVMAVAGFFLFGRSDGPTPESEVAASAADGPTIAVMAFADLSPNQDQEYFSDGISEELLNLLARVRELKVTARTSSFSFKGQKIEVPEIGRQLGVSHVLEGSVRTAGNRVRITAQLIQTADGFQVWSQNWDRTLDDIFAIQDEIAIEVVRELKVALLGAAPKSRTTDPEAYALHLQALQVSRKRTADGYAQSDSLYREVLAIDPEYVPSWVNLASNLVNEVYVGLHSADEGFPSAREAANRALELDPGSAHAYSTLGSIAVAEGDLADAAIHFQRALELDPTSTVVLGNSSALLKSLGRLDEAIALDEEVVRRDPVNVSWLFNLAAAKHWNGQYDESIALLRTVLSLSPGYSGAHLILGEALLGRGDAEEGLAAIEQESYDLFRMIGLPMAYHDLGRDAEFQAARENLITNLGALSPYDVGSVYAYCGDADGAFEWLDKSVAAADGGAILILVDNLFTSVRSDPRWLPVLRQLGKAPDQVEKIVFEVRLP